jgi:COMPASS component SPP1
MARVDKAGINIDRLLDIQAVKRARKKEGVVLITQPGMDDTLGSPGSEDQRQLDHLRQSLDKIGASRETKLKVIDALDARLRLVNLAVTRAEAIGEQCGFDTRLLMDESEWEGWMVEEGKAVLDGEEDIGEWWCEGKRKCERHAG